MTKSCVVLNLYLDSRNLSEEKNWLVFNKTFFIIYAYL